jgi:hypothetical protein
MSTEKNEIDDGKSGPAILSDSKIAALAQDTIDNSDPDYFKGDNDFGPVDPCLYQKLNIADIISKLNVTERCKALGQAYLLLDQVEKQLQFKMSRCDTHTSELIESLKLVMGFLKHANEFCYTVEDFIKETPTVKEEYQDLIDEKILEDRYDPYNLSESDFWVGEANYKELSTRHFSELKEKEICRGCYNVYHCKSRILIIRNELRRNKHIPSGLNVNMWHVVTECDKFKIDGIADGGNVPVPKAPLDLIDNLP